MGLKIGIVCYPFVGGSGIVATELGKILAERGHEIHFISSSMPFRLRKIYSHIFYHQVEVNAYSVFQYPPYDIQLACKIAEVASREKLDILHAHYAIPHAVCAIVAKSMADHDFKIVTTLHGTDITVLGADPSLKRAIKMGIEGSDFVTAVSRSLAEETDVLIRPEKNIAVVYNFVNEKIFTRVDASHLKDEFGIRPEEKVIIHVSNFRRVKRVPDVVKAFSLIAEKIPAKLLLVGDGPEMPVVGRLVKELGIGDKILFLGRQENLEELYSISDLQLLASEKESFGLAILEGMACGVPCIATRIGGIPEVIDDGRTCYLCECGNVAEMAERAVYLLTHPAIREQFVQAGLETVSNRFSSEKIVKEYEAIYLQLVNGGR